MTDELRGDDRAVFEKAREDLLTGSNIYLAELVLLTETGKIDETSDVPISLQWLENVSLKTLQHLAEDDITDEDDMGHIAVLVFDLVSLDKGTPELTFKMSEGEEWVGSLPTLCAMEVLRRRGAVERISASPLFYGNEITWKRGPRFDEVGAELGMKFD